MYVPFRGIVNSAENTEMLGNGFIFISKERERDSVMPPLAVSVSGPAASLLKFMA